MKKIFLILITFSVVLNGFTQQLSPTLTKEIDPSVQPLLMAQGAIVPYVLTVTNPNTSGVLYDLMIVDDLPSMMSLLTAQSDFVPVSGFPNRCGLPNTITLQPQQSMTFYVYAQVNASVCDGPVTNCAQIISGSFGDYPVEACLTSTNPSNIAVIPTSQDEICDCDGWANVDITGGIPPFSVLWSNGSTNCHLDNLCDDTYTYTVTDAIGCEKIQSVIVNPGSDVNIKSWVHQDPTTCGGNGSITFNWNGGTAPYTAELATNQGVVQASQQTNNNIIVFNNVPAGLYNIVVTDAGGCSDNDDPYTSIPVWIDLYVQTGLDFWFNPDPPTCPYSSDGSLGVMNITNGYGPFTYLWSTGETTASISNLCCGTYSLTMTDIYSCVRVKEYDLYSENATQTVSVVSYQNPNCLGPCNGSIEIATSLAPPFNFTIVGANTPLQQASSNSSTFTIPNLCRDNYVITVIDPAGCEHSAYQELHDLHFEMDITSTYCSPYNAGFIDLLVFGGVGTLSYNWELDGVPYATSQDITLTQNGTYCVTVTDALGCTEGGCVTIDDPAAPLDLSLDFVQPTCPDPFNGSITALPTGGATPYTYSWNTGSTTATLSDLAPNNIYGVTVEDFHGCLIDESFELNDDFLMYLVPTFENPTCVPGGDGSISIEVISGQSPYTYFWNTGETTSSINNLSTGEYSVTVSDNANCILTESFNLRSELRLAYDVIGEGCNGIDDSPNQSVMMGNGTIDLTVSGGTLPYNFTWSGGQSTEDLANLLDGSIHSVTVSDHDECYGYAEIMVGSDQTIELDAGWNIFSTYIKPFQPSIKANLEDNHIYTYVEKFFDQSSYEVIPYNGGWNYTDFFVGEGYKIDMSEAKDLTLFGSLVCPEDENVELEIPPTALPGQPQAIELFGYLRKEPQLIEDVFSNIVGDIVILKDENAAMYWPAWSYNTIITMYPDEGYDAVVSTNTSFYYDANTTFTGTKNTEFVPYHPTFKSLNDSEHLNTGDNMAVGIPTSAWDQEPELYDEIGIYSSDGKLLGRNIYLGTHTPIVVYGFDETHSDIRSIRTEEPFVIRAWNQASNKEIELKVEDWLLGDNHFRPGKISIVGSLKTNDTPLDENLTDKISSFPNPSTGSSELRVTLSENSEVQINLLNLEGKFVKEIMSNNFDQGTYLFKVDNSDVKPGIYFYKIEINNKVFTHKHIIIK